MREAGNLASTVWLETAGGRGHQGVQAAVDDQDTAGRKIGLRGRGWGYVDIGGDGRVRQGFAKDGMYAANLAGGLATPMFAGRRNYGTA